MSRDYVLFLRMNRAEKPEALKFDAMHIAQCDQAEIKCANTDIPRRRPTFGNQNNVYCTLEVQCFREQNELSLKVYYLIPTPRYGFVFK